MTKVCKVTFLCKAPSKKWPSEGCRKHSRHRFWQYFMPSPPPPPPPPLHSPYQRGEGILFLGRIPLARQRQRRRKTYCPLCNLNTLWNILMILGRNVDQDEMTCRIQDWQLWLSYVWSYRPLFSLKKISCPLCNSNTLWNISMVLGRNVEQDQTTCRVQEWQLWFSYFWSYIPLFCLK